MVLSIKFFLSVFRLNPKPLAIRRPQRACWKLSCGLLGRFPLQRGWQPSCVLHPADGPPHMPTLSALHKSDYHSSRQLECFSRIATAPQTQGTSNRAIQISSDEHCAVTWRLFLFRFPFISAWIGANECWRQHLAQRLDIQPTYFIILPRMCLKERSCQVCLSSDVTVFPLLDVGCVDLRAQLILWHTKPCLQWKHSATSYHVYIWSSASTTCSNQ